MLSLLLLACVELPSPASPEDTLTLEICPPGELCEQRADGTSVIGVEACVSDGVLVRADPLELSLSLSDGEWVGPDGGQTLSASVVEDPCLRALLQPGVDAPFVQVDAELAGMRLSDRVWLSPAAIGGVRLTPSSAQLSGEGFQQLTLTVEVDGPRGGAVSEGTRFEVELVEVEPSDTPVSIWPAGDFVDDGGGQVTLTLSGAPTAVTLRVTATPPDWPSAPDAVSDGWAEITLLAAPAD